MAERLEPSIVHEILGAERPHDVQQLVNGISKRISAPTSEVIVLLRVMVKSGALKVKRPTHPSLPTWLSTFSKQHPLLETLLLRYKTEPLIKALSLVIIFNLISSIIFIAFQTSVSLAPFRVFFHGVDLLFLPGFALTILWYPFPSAVLDFTKLDRKPRPRYGRATDENRNPRELDLLTRVAYSICYSVALVILTGFLIGLLGLGFNVLVMHTTFTLIEILVIIVTIYKIQRIKDPYLKL